MELDPELRERHSIVSQLLGRGSLNSEQAQLALSYLIWPEDEDVNPDQLVANIKAWVEKREAAHAHHEGCKGLNRFSEPCQKTPGLDGYCYFHRPRYRPVERKLTELVR